MRIAGGPILFLVLLAGRPAWPQQREYLDALRLARDRQPERALETLREAVRDHPDFGRAWARMVTVAADARQLDAVRAYLETQAASGQPHAHYGVAMANLQGKQWEAAEQRLIACIEEAPEFLPAYAELATLARQRDRVSTALALFERLARAGSGRGAPEFGLGYLRMLQGDSASALEALGNATALRPAAFEIADAVYFVHYQANRYGEALDIARDMLKLADRTGDIEWQGRLFGRTGMIHLDLGDLTAATAELGQAVEIAHDLGSRGEQIFRGNLGAAYARLARYADAVREYSEALRLARAAGDRLNEGRHLGLIAAIYADTAEYSRAAAIFGESIAIARETGDRPSEATQNARLALLYDAFGEPARALQSVERSLTVARELKNPWLEGRFLEIQGLILRNLGRLRESLAAHQRGLQVAQAVRSKYGEAAAWWRTGDAHLRLGEQAPARNCYRQALALAGGIGARSIQAAAFDGLGRLEIRAGNRSAGIESHAAALKIGEDIRSPEIIWQAHAGLAGASASVRPAEALAHYRAALDAVEQVRGRLTLVDERAGFLDDKVRVYRDMAGLLMQLHAFEPSAGYDAEAFRIAERAHARSFLDLLAESKDTAGNVVEPALLARRREIESAIGQLQSRLVAEYGRPKPVAATLAALDSQLSAAAEEHAAVLRRFRERTTGEAGDSLGAPLTLAQVRQLLPPDSVLIEYSIGESASFLFAVSGSRYVVARLPPARVILARVRQLRAAIAARPTRMSLSNYLLQARQLYRDLLAPAASLISGHRQWIVVPDGVLHYLPFEALVEPGEFDAAPDPATLPYLVRKHAISYVQSASVLAALQRDRRRATGAPSFVAFADPLYPAAPSAGRGAITAAATRLARLPHTRREVQAIGELYEFRRIFLGDQASEEQVKIPGALDAHVVQFAVHGLLNEERPQFSGLALSIPRPSDDAARAAIQEDGLLQVYEVLNLRTSADLVILSACETGLGRERQGEGLTGLTQAFLSAGAASVVVSLWKVEDRSTADLMIGFHRHLRSGAIGKSQALRRARLELIGKGGAFAHPYYWAPFVLVGLPN